MPIKFVIMGIVTRNKNKTSSTNKVSCFVRWPWLKDLLMTFLATTFSIVLTFGTAALIDKRQKEKNKRQMVMYVLYDMNRSLDMVEKFDSLLRRGLEVQIEVDATPRFSRQRNSFSTVTCRLSTSTTPRRKFSRPISRR